MGVSIDRTEHFASKAPVFLLYSMVNILENNGFCGIIIFINRSCTDKSIVWSQIPLEYKEK